MKITKKLFNDIIKLLQLETKLLEQTSKVGKKLNKFTDFDIFITFQASDGVVVSDDDGCNVLLGDFLDYIQEHGTINQEEFQKLSAR
ncbi:MAG: hypothetical protein NC222_06325 [Staphylococcus sp.]|nr:hypothetical protein [Staphylococcus sp.]